MESEMWLFECDVPGPPIGKGRPRGTTQGGYVKLYTPKKTADWERSCAFVVRSQWSGAPLEGAVEIEFVAVFPRPKRLLRKKKRYSSKVEGPSVYFRLRQLDEGSSDEERWFD